MTWPAAPTHQEVARRRPATGLGTGAALGVLGAVLVLSLAAAVAPALTYPGHLHLGETAQLAVSLVPLLAYVGAVALVGRTPVGRLAGAGVAAAAIPVHLAFWFVLTGDLSRPDLVEHRDLLFMARQVLVGLLAVAAWGLARRSNAIWWVGLVVVPLLFAGQWPLRHDVGRAVWEVATATGMPPDTSALVVYQALWWGWATIPLLLAGLACWGLDRVGGRAVRYDQAF